MSEDTLTLVCIAGVIIVAILIIVIANFSDIRLKKKQSKQLKKDMDSGAGNTAKKYFGNQGNWQPGDNLYDQNDNARDNNL